MNNRPKERTVQRSMQRSVQSRMSNSAAPTTAKVARRFTRYPAFMAHRRLVMDSNLRQLSVYSLRLFIMLSHEWYVARQLKLEITDKAAGAATGMSRSRVHEARVGLCRHGLIACTKTETGAVYTYLPRSKRTQV